MSMFNDRSKTTASVNHFTHNGIRTDDPLVELYWPPFAACLPACLPGCTLTLGSSAQLPLPVCIGNKVAGKGARGGEQLDGVKMEEKDGQEEEVEVENYSCATLAAVRWWRRCADLHEVITRFDDRGTITELCQQRQQQWPSCLCESLIAKLCCLSTGIFREGLGSNRRVPARLQKNSDPKWCPVFDSWLKIEPTSESHSWLV